MSPAAPTTEIGRGNVGFTLPGWGQFASAIDEREYAPDLIWPNSISTYRRMETDAQISGLLLGTMLPIRRFRWSIEQGEASDEVTEHIARDFNLPITGQDAPPPVKRSEARNRFSHDRHLAHALRALVYGHYPFEQVGAILSDDRWHLRKLAPRPPFTIAEGGSIEVDPRDGGLAGIKQAVGMQSKLIPVDRLVYYCWDQEGSDWIGRSMIRSCFRHWARKDRLLRVDAMKHERNSMGVPWFETDKELSQPQVDALAAKAQAFRSGDQAGGAGPGKLQIKGVDGSLPDIIESIHYDDQQMSMAMLMLFADLGRSTATGSYAQSASLIDWYGYAQESIADWYAGVTTEHAIWDDVDWNFGPDENAPKLVYDRSAEEDLPISDLAVLVDKGVVTPDDALEDAIRSKHNLPERVEEDESSDPRPVEIPPVAAKRRPPARAAATVPERELRREPYEHEVQAAVDFEAMDTVYVSERDQLVSSLREAQGTQIDELHEQIVAADGDLEKLVGLAATPVAGEQLQGAMSRMLDKGVEQATSEAKAQGIDVDAPDTSEAETLLAARAAATNGSLARSLSETASRKALQISGGTLTPVEVADQTKTHLEGLTEAFLVEQATGVLTQSQNTGRNVVFRENPPSNLYGSALLDDNTCDECVAWDGEEFENVDELEQQFPAGNKDCLGGPRCRCTGVAVYRS